VVIHLADHHGYPTAAAFVPEKGDLAALAHAALGCQGCDLYERATQTVFGEGSADAVVVLVGEQPGDSEDRQGRPFVGPAGRLLDSALGDAGISRDRAYITSAVKHFRWKPAPSGGKRRIHQRPDLWQVSACRPWLDAEFARLSPQLVVTLGATAGQALFGSSFRIGDVRGETLSWQSGPGSDELTVVPTVHPSSVIRVQGAEREVAYAAFVKDLQVAAALLTDGSRGTG
jgi:uracil-DNA glycosylase family protein